MASPNFLGSGGGLHGAIKKRIDGDAGAAGYFQERVRTGVHPIGTGWPRLSLYYIGDDHSVSSTGQDLVGEIHQVSIFAEGADATRNLGRYVHSMLRQDENGRPVCYEADGQSVSLLPMPGGILMQDPETSENAEDVWHWARRYRVWSVE